MSLRAERIDASAVVALRVGAVFMRKIRIRPVPGCDWPTANAPFGCGKAFLRGFRTQVECIARFWRILTYAQRSHAA